MALPALALLTPEEYLAFEVNSKEKHEFYDGYIVAMAGASDPHMAIQTNLIIAFGNKIRSKKRPCKVFGSDARVYIDETKYFYPDVTIYCSKIDIDEQNTIRNPDVVIEILSQSTATYDQNEKATAYRKMPSLKQLFLIDSRKKSVVVYTHAPDGSWNEKVTENPGASLNIADEEVSLSEIYEDVFEERQS